MSKLVLFWSLLVANVRMKLIDELMVGTASVEMRFEDFRNPVAVGHAGLQPPTLQTVIGFLQCVARTVVSEDSRPVSPMKDRTTDTSLGDVFLNRSSSGVVLLWFVIVN